MRTKKYLSGSWLRLRLHVRSIGLLSVFPFFVVNLLLPLLSFMVYRKEGATDAFHLGTIQFGQWLMPLCSILNVLFVLREYVESPGKEILFVCRNKCKLLDFLFVFLLSLGNIFILFVVYELFWPGLFFEFFRIASVCILFFGITYFLTFLTKTIYMPLMTLLLYTIASIMTYTDRMLFPLYYSNEFVSLPMFVRYYLPFALTGVVLLVIGVFINKKKHYDRCTT